MWVTLLDLIFLEIEWNVLMWCQTSIIGYLIWSVLSLLLAFIWSHIMAQKNWLHIEDTLYISYIISFLKKSKWLYIVQIFIKLNKQCFNIFCCFEIHMDNCSHIWIAKLNIYNKKYILIFLNYYYMHLIYNSKSCSNIWTL